MRHILHERRLPDVCGSVQLLARQYNQSLCLLPIPRTRVVQWLVGRKCISIAKSLIQAKLHYDNITCRFHILVDLTGEVRIGGLPCHGHGHLAAAAEKLWQRRAIQATVVAVPLQWIKNKWVHGDQGSEM